MKTNEKRLSSWTEVKASHLFLKNALQTQANVLFVSRSPQSKDFFQWLQVGWANQTPLGNDCGPWLWWSRQKKAGRLENSMCSEKCLWELEQSATAANTTHFNFGATVERMKADKKCRAITSLKSLRDLLFPRFLAYFRIHRKLWECTKLNTSWVIRGLLREMPDGLSTLNRNHTVIKAPRKLISK